MGNLATYCKIPALLLTLILNGCACIPVSDNLWLGPKPPVVSQYSQLSQHLRDTPNESIGSFACYAGFLSTPFKRIGVLGWHDTGHSAQVEGTIVNPPTLSTDNFLTVDLHVINLTVDDKPVELSGNRYLRAEICTTCLDLKPQDFPRTGQTISMAGRILWDGDGFFEIHPTSKEGLTWITSRYNEATQRSDTKQTLENWNVIKPYCTQHGKPLSSWIETSPP